MFTTQDWDWFMYTTYISGEIREWFMAYGIALPTFVDFQEKKHQQQIQGKKSQSQSAGYTDGGAPVASD